MNGGRHSEPDPATPFELSNASASFQTYVNKILAKKVSIFVIAFLDNILICTEDPGQGHVEAVGWVLEILLAI